MEHGGESAGATVKTVLFIKEKNFTSGPKENIKISRARESKKHELQH